MKAFGEIVDGAMRLNDVGRMVIRWLYAVEQRFANVVCDTVICMPDHIHFVLIILEDEALVAAEMVAEANQIVDRPQVNINLGRIVGWFKTMTTNEYIRRVRANEWPSFRKRLWQRNYYERIVRDAEALRRIRQYIADNPRTWNP